MELSSPRSAEASAVRSLKFMFPALQYENDDSERMIQAQKELARIQMHAASIVKEEEDINEIAWELDTWWLQDHGVVIY